MDITDSELTAGAIRAWIDERHRRAAEEALRQEQAAKEEQDRLRKHFLEDDVPEDAMTQVAKLVRRAVEAGENRVLVVHFPAAWLPDRGRRINNRDETWPEHLDGFAKRAYAYFERELKPRGFKLRAEIISWPDGVPGEVGFFLQW
jgi:hypothetical protein